HAGAEVVLDVALQVAFNLLPQLALAPGPQERVGQAQQPGAQPPHGTSSPGFRKRARMAVARSHSAVLPASCWPRGSSYVLPIGDWHKSYGKAMEKPSSAGGADVSRRGRAT